MQWKVRHWFLKAALSAALLVGIVSCGRSGTDSASPPQSSKQDEPGTKRPSAFATSKEFQTTKPSPLQPPGARYAAKLGQILALPNKSERQQALDGLAEELAAQDPQEAAALAKRILAEKGETTGEAYAFVSGFMSRYAAAEPVAAADWGAFLPLMLKFVAFTPVAQQWAAQDWQAATSWAQGIEDLSLRSSVLRRISEQLEGAGRPEVAGTWAQMLSKTSDAAQHTEIISRLWTATDVEGAYQWSVQLPTAEARTAALVAMAGALAEKDPVTASQWVEKFPDEGARRQAAGSMISRWTQTDPEAAARWVARQGDAQLLETSIRTIGGRWLEVDRTKATQWIQNAPLSKETKSYLLGSEPNGRTP